MNSSLSQDISYLNPRQKKAVLQTTGPVLILAGAGSGKTKVITMRVAHLLSKGVTPNSILAVTFTNKAAKEMKNRVVSLVNQKTKKLPVISTFHSLCLRILRREIHHLGYQNNFNIYDTSDQLSLVRTLLSDTKITQKTVKPDTVLNLVLKSKQNTGEGGNGSLHLEDELTHDDELLALSHVLTKKYQQALKTLNVLDFDDLILLTLKLFQDYKEVQARYSEKFTYLMVDEYQDTNLIQYKLLKLLAGEKKNICVVGDDDQSIYSWRGAQIGNILNFQKDFPGTLVVKLEENYRSFGNILKVANNVIGFNKKRMEKTLWTKGGPGPKVGIFKARNEQEEAAWVTKTISLARYEQKLPYEHFAIIYRSNSFSKLFEEELRRNSIPYTVVGGTSFFERKEIKDLSCYLKIIANPSDNLSLLRIANIPKRGLGMTTLYKLTEFAKENKKTLLETMMQADLVPEISDKAIKSSISLSHFIKKYQNLFLQSSNFGITFEKLIEEIDYSSYICQIYKTPGAASKKIENINGFIDSLHRFSENNEKDQSLSLFLERLALTDIIKNEDKTIGVTLTSFHSSKGLEFPVVFIVGMEEDIMPHKKSFGSKELEEERRLFYVGITRTMKRLYITLTGVRKSYGKAKPSTPSRFIDEMPDDASEWLNGKREDNENTENDVRAFFTQIKDILKPHEK